MYFPAGRTVHKGHGTCLTRSLGRKEKKNASLVGDDALARPMFSRGGAAVEIEIFYGLDCTCIAYWTADLSVGAAQTSSSILEIRRLI